MNASLNHYLSSPSKLFAYIQAELPILASNFPYFKELVLGEKLGMVCDPQKPTEIAKGIEHLLKYKDAFREGMSEVRARYCWEIEEEKFLNVYRGLWWRWIKVQK